MQLSFTQKKHIRKNFGKLVEGLSIPNLIEVQKNSYNEFLESKSLKDQLSELSKGAEDIGQFSASINAEKIRCALGGLTIDRRETVHSLDDMTREDIISRLTQLQKQYPQAFIEGDFEEIKDDNREKLLETTKK